MAVAIGVGSASATFRERLSITRRQNFTVYCQRMALQSSTWSAVHLYALPNKRYDLMVDVMVDVHEDPITLGVLRHILEGPVAVRRHLSAICLDVESGGGTSLSPERRGPDADAAIVAAVRLAGAMDPKPGWTNLAYIGQRTSVYWPGIRFNLQAIFEVGAVATVVAVLIRMVFSTKSEWAARHGRCGRCGYPLEGIVGSCPECGQPPRSNTSDTGTDKPRQATPVESAQENNAI